MQFYATKTTDNLSVNIDRSSREARLKITNFAIHYPFLFPLFLGGKRKGENSNQSHAFMLDHIDHV